MAVVFGWDILTPYISMPFLVEAGQATKLELAIPEGYCCTRANPLKISSDYYSKDIIVWVKVDDQDISPDGMALSSPIEMTFGKFFVKRFKVEVVVQNDSDTDAIITVQFPCHMVKKSVVEKIFMGLMSRSCCILCEFLGIRVEEVD